MRASASSTPTIAEDDPYVAALANGAALAKPGLCANPSCHLPLADNTEALYCDANCAALHKIAIAGNLRHFRETEEETAAKANAELAERHAADQATYAERLAAEQREASQAPATAKYAPKRRQRAPEPPPAAEPPPTPPATPDDDGPFPFTMLGHDHGVYFYLGHGSRQVTQLQAGAHSAKNLYRLAPPSFWDRTWPAKRGFDEDQAAGDLMQMQHRIGVYSPSRIRGRGAWWDKQADQAVIHLGDRLLIGGQAVGLHEHGTGYIYEYAVPISIDLGNPMRKAQAAALEDVCKLISWEEPVSGRLLAGWIVCASICGALRWKPNLWLLGARESGKSTVIEQIVYRALGDNTLYCLGGTTEASLRAQLRADAMPIIIDDMDASTARARENNQAILGLMRIFSGEGGGSVHKASQNGGPVITYKIHSCYIYSGIVMEADKSADKSRIQVLKLAQRKFEAGQFQDLLAKIHSVITPDFAPALFARCIQQIPMIRKNAEVFAQAVGKKTGSQRSGDVLGHLFAGAWSLRSEAAVTPEQAAAYVGNRSEVMALIEEQKQDIAEAHEGELCLWHLMEQILVDQDGSGRTVRNSVYDLVMLAQSQLLNGDHARALLKRHGIIADGGAVYVANDHTQLRNLYKTSAWPVGWGGVLKTIQGVSAADRMRFGGRQSRASRIPMAVLQRIDKPRTPMDELPWETPVSDAKPEPGADG